MDVSSALITAVREGRLARARELINTFELSYSPEWEEGYVLLCEASKNRHYNIAKLLMMNGSRINSQIQEPTDAPLHFAVRNGDIGMVEMLLNNGADVDASSKENLTSLLIATKNKNEELVQILLNRGANVNSHDEDGRTVLSVAVEYGYQPIIEHILKYCPDIDNESNRSSLNFAVLRPEEKYRAIVENLLQYGYAIKPEDANDNTLLYAAIVKGYLKIVEDLLMYGVDINNIKYDFRLEEGFTPLHVATKYKQEKVAIRLVNYGADVNAKDESGKIALYYAVENWDLKITELLSTNGADIQDNLDLLKYAIRVKPYTNTDIQKNIVEILLQYYSNINHCNEYGQTVLHAVVHNCTHWDYILRESKKKIVELLLNKGANVNAQTVDGETALHFAVQNVYESVLEVLLEYNADVNCRSKNGMTPLHFCGNNLDGKVAERLLAKGADVNAQQETGLTVLHMASAICNDYLVKLLLKWGARVNFKDKEDKTPLHIAAQSKYENVLDTIHVLLRYGADVESRDKYGRTALHYAAIKGHKDVVETLLKFCAEIDPIDECGRTPLHVAAQEKCTEVVVTLLEYGSNINIVSKNNSTVLDFIKGNVGSLPKIVDDDDDDTTNDWYEDQCEDDENTIRILKYHIVKMKTANLYQNNENLLMINTDDETSKFQNECEKELEGIKKEKICNGSISLYDILTNSANQLAVYARNENIIQELQLKDCRRKFPLYAGLINGRLRNGMKRNWLLERGSTLLNSLFNSFSHLPNLPPNCTENILSHLNDKYLIILTGNSIMHDSKSMEDFPPLHLAIKNRQKEVATQLINCGADVNIKDKSGKPPICYAIENIDLEITKLLLTNGADITDPHLLNTAVKKGSREIVEILLKHEVDVKATDQFRRTALHFSTYNHLSVSKREIIELLLSSGANINAKTTYGETALHNAIENENETVVTDLLECNADVNCRSNTGMTPLHLSVDRQHEKIVQLLLNKGANVNAQQEDSSTALHIASGHSNVKVVELLLKHGAHVNSKDKENKTPLHLAADKCREEVVEILLEFGANIDCRDKYGKTPLHIAAENGSFEITMILLKFSPDIDLRDECGMTPLHVASKGGHTKVVVALLGFGSDINIISKDNYTVIDTVMEGISLLSPVWNMDEDVDLVDLGYNTPLEEVLMILKQHIFAMKIANLYLSNKNLLMFSSDTETGEFQNECEKELEAIKNEICHDTVSLYDILTNTANKLAVYAGNEHIEQNLKWKDYKKKFPIYARLIHGRFRYGQRRKRLLEQGNIFFNHLDNFCDLPYECIEKIMSYLDDEDLRVLASISISECYYDNGPICKKPKLDYSTY